MPLVWLIFAADPGEIEYLPIPWMIISRWGGNLKGMCLRLHFSLSESCKARPVL